MNNKCGCGWEQSWQTGSGCQGGNGFVPVNGNWDFNMDGCRQSGSGCQRQNRCNTCEKAEKTCTRTARENVCTACGKPRNACTCGQKAYTGCERNVCTHRADCTCERCTRSRQADGCQREETCPVCGKARSACTCNHQTYARTECCEERTAPACVMKTEKPACGGAKKGVGMVRVTKQNLGDIFDNARALKAGTLFPELHKPMNGYWPCGTACGDDCQQAAFAAWELRLYLDTHPEDEQARALLQQIIGDCCEPNYATTFLTENCARWTWTDNPWPWEYDCKDQNDGCLCRE